MSVHAAARDAARALARKNRSQVRIPARKPDQWIQATIQAYAPNNDAMVLRANSSVPFAAKVGGHFIARPTVGSTVWVVMISGTSPIVMSR